MSKAALHLRRLIVSALFLSIALVMTSMFSFFIPMFGQNGMKISISGIFSIMPSILFGPVYGALTSGLSDVIGYLLKPAGAYIPVMTLIVAGGAFFRGLIWQILRKRNGKKMRIVVAALALVLLIAGFTNMMFLNDDGVNGDFYENVAIEEINTQNMHLISRLLVERTISAKAPSASLAPYLITVTYGFISSAFFAFMLIFIDLILSWKLYKNTEKGRIMQLLLALLVSGLAVTTLNTIVMRETIFQSWKTLPFMAVWLPRLIEEVLGNIIKVYFIEFLLELCERQPFIKKLL